MFSPNAMLIIGLIIGGFLSYFLLLLFLQRAMNLFKDEIKNEILNYINHIKPENEADWWKNGPREEE